MRNRFFQINQFVKHVFTARNTGGFGVHSPYLFHFTRYILKENFPFYCFREIENERQKLCSRQDFIEKTDFGTGKSKRINIASIAHSSLGKARKLQLLFRIINHYQFYTVLELGTSLGISTAYMALANSKLKCITLEGCEQTAAIAMQTFENLKIQNIQQIVGNIDVKLTDVLSDVNQIDFVYMDANHTFEATSNYFDSILPHLSENAIVVIDDIYWSTDMQKAWTKIIDHPKVTSSINLFSFGIVFMKPDLHKKHYKMRF
jgi:predicted O-methyltransferase YrrM